MIQKAREECMVMMPRAGRPRVARAAGFRGMRSRLRRNLRLIIWNFVGPETGWGELIRLRSGKSQIRSEYRYGSERMMSGPYLTIFGFRCLIIHVLLLKMYQLLLSIVKLVFDRNLSVLPKTISYPPFPLLGFQSSELTFRKQIYTLDFRTNSSSPTA